MRLRMAGSARREEGRSPDRTSEPNSTAKSSRRPCDSMPTMRATPRRCLSQATTMSFEESLMASRRWAAIRIDLCTLSRARNFSPRLRKAAAESSRSLIPSPPSFAIIASTSRWDNCSMSGIAMNCFIVEDGESMLLTISRMAWRYTAAMALRRICAGFDNPNEEAIEASAASSRTSPSSDLPSLDVMLCRMTWLSTSRSPPSSLLCALVESEKTTPSTIS
mmetsp:Transcript_5723/g.17027  ORF Transcript_5723/g.17027 Transcript_5723/m.17027 type:complete len:221 (-) Transcript_5723:797-1459(-)